MGSALRSGHPAHRTQHRVVPLMRIVTTQQREAGTRAAPTVFGEQVWVRAVRSRAGNRTANSATHTLERLQEKTKIKTTQLRIIIRKKRKLA